jgi:hypothetical protein
MVDGFWLQVKYRFHKHTKIIVLLLCCDHLTLLFSFLFLPLLILFLHYKSCLRNHLLDFAWLSSRMMFSVCCLVPFSYLVAPHWYRRCFFVRSSERITEWMTVSVPLLFLLSLLKCVNFFDNFLFISITIANRHYCFFFSCQLEVRILSTTTPCSSRSYWDFWLFVSR